MTAAARLRPVEARPGPDGDVLLCDPLGAAGGADGGPVRVSAFAWRVARRLDGSASPAEIARSLSSAAGVPEEPLRVARAIEELSLQGLLDDQRGRGRLAEARAAFAREADRPARGPGRDYPADPLELRIRVGGLVANDWDMPPPPGLVGVLAPAAGIDRAAPLYARAYAALRHTAGGFARAILLGAARAPVERVLVPLAKDFVTPLGRMALDREACAALGIDPGEDALAHRLNLVLERQLLFLCIVAPRLPALPLLVGAYPEGGRAAARAQALAALARVAALPGRTLCIAATDLARLLPAEPGSTELGPGARRDLRARDGLLVDRAVAGDAEGWWAAASGAGDAALRAAAVPVDLLLGHLAARHPELRGHVLGYHQDAAAGEFTTSAAVAFVDGAQSESR